MAGHSKFKNIMHRKGAQDAKRAKLFTKIGREIMAACKVGFPDPAQNPRLRTAIQWARSENMPNDRINSAIKKASSSADGDHFDEIRYEGYGAGGVAILIEALTDNRNRTASEVRSTFTKNGGNLGELGSVSFMFNHVGIITYPIAVADEETMLEAAIEAGANDCETDAEHHHIITANDTLAQVRDALETKFGEAKVAKLQWQPQQETMNTVSDDHAASIIKLLDILDDLDDVQSVVCNADFTDEQMAAV